MRYVATAWYPLLKRNAARRLGTLLSRMVDTSKSSRRSWMRSGCASSTASIRSFSLGLCVWGVGGCVVCIYIHKPQAVHYGKKGGKRGGTHRDIARLELGRQEVASRRRDPLVRQHPLLHHAGGLEEKGGWV